MANLLSVVFLIFILSGCSTLMVSPKVHQTKRIALVSLYMNKSFYNIESPTTNEGVEDLLLLVKNIAERKAAETFDVQNNEDDDERIQIITYALKQYTKQLEQFSQWELIPVDSVMSNEEYRKYLVSDQHGSFLKGLTQTTARELLSYVVTAPGMIVVPFTSVTKSGKTYYYGGAQDPMEENKERLAKLCESLNVDAVAIIELDMAFRYGKLYKFNWMGRTVAVPSVSSEIVMVDKQGEVILRTGFNVKGQGKRFEGEGADMVINDVLHLEHKNNKAVEVYNQAVEKAAQLLHKKIEDAFKKG